MAWVVSPTGASSLYTATLLRNRKRNCWNLYNSSRSMPYGMDTGVSELRIIRDLTKHWDFNVSLLEDKKIIFFL